VIIPFETESYGSTRDPPEADIPFCTLKSFPNSIEHTIEWARDLAFENLFSQRVLEFNKFMEEENLIERLRSNSIQASAVKIVAKLLKKRPSSFSDCVRMARLKFERWYKYSMLQLLHSFPIDHQMKDGSLFWSAPKRPPTPLEFDINDTLHMDFIVSFANLWAFIYHIPPTNDLEAIKQVCISTPVPEFRPKQDKKIEIDETAKKTQKETPEDQQERFISEILEFLSKNSTIKLSPVEFEKDDDTNFHIDFINAASNLRARVYKIQEVDRLKTKRIAGRIMPAIATTTSAVSGLVALELIKVLSKTAKLSQYKNAFLNLALPLLQFSEPGTAPKSKVTDDIFFTLWDRWDVRLGDITLTQFIEYFKNKYDLQVTGVFQETSMVYVPLVPMHRKRLPQKMSQLLKNPSGYKYIDLIVSFSRNGEDIAGPGVRYYF